MRQFSLSKKVSFGLLLLSLGSLFVRCCHGRRMDNRRSVRCRLDDCDDDDDAVAAAIFSIPSTCIRLERVLLPRSSCDDRLRRGIRGSEIPWSHPAVTVVVR